MGIVRTLLRKRVVSEEQAFGKFKAQYSSKGSFVFAGDLLRKAAKKNPLKIALIEKDKKINYKEFYFRSVQLGNEYRLRGVKARDRVVIYNENSIEFYISYFAAWLIGAVVVPVNTFLHEKELAYIINDARPSLIVTMSELKKKLESAVASKFIEKLPPIITEQDLDWNEAVPDFFEDIEKNDAREVLAENEMCLLLYTSGTTGVPKGVMLSSKNIVSNTLQSMTRMQKLNTGKEKVLSVLPLFHVFAQHTCMWFPIMTGAAAIIVPRIERRNILEGLKLKPTIFFGFPALFGLLCLMKNAPLDSIKLFVSGADAMPDKIRAAFSLIYGRKIAAGYGLTEVSPVVAFNFSEDESPAVHVGKPLFGIECDIRDENEKSLKLGEVGNLWLRGDNVMLGYHNAKEATDKILKDGWLNTGDLSSMDAKGNLFIRGRSKDIIIRNGINIYPQEVENILMSHPKVFKAAVIGRDEAIAGQVPIAFVAVKDKNKDMEVRLRSLCAKSLASYKIPRKIVCLDDLPMSATGKIDKKQLKAN